MTPKIKIRQYVIFIEPRKYDTADMKQTLRVSPYETAELLREFKLNDGVSYSL